MKAKTKRVGRPRKTAIVNVAKTNKVELPLDTKCYKVKNIMIEAVIFSSHLNNKEKIAATQTIMTGW